MATKPRAATRSSSRNKLQADSTSSVPRLTRSTAASTSKDIASKVATAVPAKATGRKPFVSRDNSPELKQPLQRATKSKVMVAQQKPAVDEDSDDREPVKAYLRVRPDLNNDEDASSTPYLELMSRTSVRMVDPSAPSSSRLSSINPSSVYTFTHVFPPETTQPDFFARTTLPLVKGVLEGENALLFAYGVTNSGKTYTIQGGGEEGSAGILPRSLDVIFNSIEGLHGDGRYQPVRLQGIELADEGTYPLDPSSRYRASSVPALADILQNLSISQAEMDTTTLKLDRNHEYTIWISYAEVYNEKVYDLLASVDDPSATQLPPPSGIPRPTSSYLNLPVPTSQSNPLLLTRKALAVKPCPASDSDSGDHSSAGRYVAGLRQLRVHSASQAKELLRLGQLHRTVFGTLANSQSSRSHAFVTIKILRVHRGERNDPTSIQTSRLTLVDLAGSERTKHTQTTGDRLREAGNINNSLMVLGQCMETMRNNQRVLARSLAGGVNAGSRLDTRDVKRGLAVVPFRHSKLTEILMDYFVGEGRVAMILNINPYDTGYDENSHVMKFAALAREVATTAPTAIPRPLPKATSSKAKGPAASHTRKVTLSIGGSGKKLNETHLEVLEEDEEMNEGDDGDDGDEPINPLVNALFDEIEMLRMQLFEAEIKAAVIEAETREEVMQEMEARMRNMEKMYTRRLMAEVQQHEMKMDEKLDMLQHSGLLGKRAQRQAFESESEGEQLEDIDEEDEVNQSLRSEYTEVHENDSHSDLSRSPSPLAGKTKPKTSSIKPLARPQSAEHDHSMIEKESSDEEVDDGIEDWNSPPPTEKKSKILKSPPPLLFESDVEDSSEDKVEDLEDELNGLTLSADIRDSIAVVPNKPARQKAVASGGSGVEYVPKPGEVEEVVKKKRQLKKTSVPVEASLRRSTRASKAG
ncbi:P-loop containing nucleoside triphosphate hydrolase protein [Cristinia sonorae]|uniref:Kinesin-like protein n=1 Tax=Cristinia sonorae TaxID=1940300 RepID=A0A8K0UG00_9AGAR|nr:P-loop containing nucleoside triphosphate hydrolase protein [Cristinia sonorae]